jgi:hypothetical protein
MAEYYLECLAQQKIGVDRERFINGMRYAHLSTNFYTLWLLYLKWKADPGGKLPGWMSRISAELFDGELIRLAKDASCCL